MAKTIATIGGIALAPGVSRNRRLYTREHIAGAVARAQERIKAGDEPMVMLSHHGADDRTREIAASLRSISLDENGSARYTAAIADTPAGRDIAALADTSDGQPPYLKGVSIRGYWRGTVRKVAGPDGEPAETADGLEIDGLDFTRKPGVPDAAVDTFAWAGQSGATETTERVLITESVQEARVTIAEETLPAAGDISEAADAKTAAPPGTTYADPGYLKDKKKRYPLNTPARIRAAWSYINQKDNAAQYTAAQLKRIKGKIGAAMKRIGAAVADEGYVVWPAEQVTETALAGYDDGSRNASVSVCASNGPLNISVSSYCIDPADLDLILRAAADAACKAFAAMDPDMDGDIDVPGADAEDTDGDMGGEADDLAARLAAVIRGESAGPLDDLIAEARTASQVTGTVPTEDPAPEPDAVTTETEAPAVSETTTETAPAGTGTAETAPAAPAAAVTLSDDQFKALLEAARPAPAGTGTGKPEAAEAAAPAVAETEDERVTRLVQEGITARLRAEGALPVAETEDQRIARLVEEGVTAAKQQLVASGQVTPGRKGLVTEHTAPVTAGGEMPPAPPGKSWDEMHKWSTEELNQYSTPGLADYVFGGRAGTIG